jgi:uncharacterized DUF497 family protein
MSYEWDPAKAESNLNKHDVYFADAVGVLEDEQSLWHEDVGNREEDRYIAVGMDFLGRILTIVFTIRGETVRLISARPATKNERSIYEQRR